MEKGLIIGYRSCLTGRFFNGNRFIPPGHLFFLFLGIMSILLLTPPAHGQTADAIRLAIDHSKIDEDLTDFPVLIHLSDNSGISGVDVSGIFSVLTADTDRKKIIIKTHAGRHCYVEIEKWDPAGSEAWLWVKVPQISAAADTGLTILYDVTAEDNVIYVGDQGEPPAQTVWDNAFIGVWHMAESPTGGVGCIKDSTAHGIDGTPAGSLTAEHLVQGQIGNALDFNGVDAYIDLGNPVVLESLSGPFTVEAVAQPAGLSQNGIILSLDPAGTQSDYALGIYNSGNRLVVGTPSFRNGLTPIDQYLTPGTARQWTTKYQSRTDLEFFLDGQKQILTDVADYFAVQGNRIGARGSATFPYTGMIDEIRISAGSRSDAWIKAAFYSNFDNLITYIPPGEIPPDEIPPPAVQIHSVNEIGNGSTVTLDWTGYDESVDDVIKYRIYAHTEPFTHVSGLTPIGSVLSGTFVYTVPNLTEGVTYYFAVVAVDVAGNALETVTPTPGTPIPYDDVFAKKLILYIDPDRIDEALAEFPVLLHLSQDCGANKFDASGFFSELSTLDLRKNLVVETASGAQCPVEIEKFDTVNKEAFLWVKVPVISPDETTLLTLYYDASETDNSAYVGDTGEGPAQAVWENHYIAVWHMAQDPSSGAGSMTDAAGNGNDGTPALSMGAESRVHGPVGDAIRFDGSDDFIDLGSAGSLSNLIHPFTVEAVVVPATLAQNGIVLSLEPLDGASRYAFGIYNSGDRLVLGTPAYPYGLTPIGDYLAPDAARLWTTTYRNSADMAFFLDGRKQSLTHVSDYFSVDDNNIGARGGGTFPFQGVLDEIRISDIDRTDAWIRATYLSVFDRLVSFSATSDITPPPEVDNLQINEKGNGTSVSLDWSGYDESIPGDIAGYRIYAESTSFSDTAGLTPKGEVEAGTFSYVVENLTEGITYYFAVVAVDLSGNARGFVSSPVSGVPTLQGTRVSGTITQDTVWTLEGSPYIVIGDVSVEYPDTSGNTAVLTIAPGVEVRFDPGTGLYIGHNFGGFRYGALDARGTEASPIIFTSNAENPAPGDWKGIRFRDPTEDALSVLEHCRIRFGGNEYGANVYLEHAKPTIKRCIISQSSQSGLVIDGTGCRDAAVTCVTLQDNQEGVTVTNDALPRIHECNFLGNAGYGLHNLGDATIPAENNWWGDAAGPGQGGDAINGDIDVDPWLASETDCVVTDVVSPEIADLEIDGRPLADGFTLYDSGFITLTTEDLSGIDKVDFFVDGNLIRSATGGASQNTFYLDIASFEDGDHDLSIAAYDPIGNATTFDCTIQTAFNAPVVAGNGQMNVGGQQVLSVMNYQSGNTYTWSLSGGGSLYWNPEDPSTATYTAPESNPGCSQNATILLSDSGGNSSEFTIAVNALPIDEPAFGIKTEAGECMKAFSTAGFAGYGIRVNVKTYRCDGSLYCSMTPKVEHVEKPEIKNCDGFCDDAVLLNCGGPYENWLGAACSTWVDLRTPEMMAQGCCFFPPPEEFPGPDGCPETDCECKKGEVGNPIHIASGSNFERETDIQLPSPGNIPFVFERAYNSRLHRQGPTGYGWTHNFHVTLDPDFIYRRQSYLQIIDASGVGAYFRDVGDGKTYVGVFKEKSRVEKIDGTYIWSQLDGKRYGFTLDGRLSWMEDPIGNRIALTYDTENRLETVTDAASGRSFGFHYTEDGDIESVTGPASEAVPGNVWVNYGYDASGNLISVSYADGSGFDYTYTDPNDIHNLTEKRNKAGHLLASWTYDDQDRAIENVTRDGKGVSIDYVSDTEIRVTDAYGVTRTYTIGNMDGRKRVTDIGGSAGCPTCGADVVRIEYDRALRVIEKEYANGLITQYGNYDRRGNAGLVKEAVGTPEEKTITYTFHPEINVKLSQTEPSIIGEGNKVTIWDYDNDGNATPNENPTRLLHRKIERGYTQDATGAVVPYEYITAYTYNSRGQVLSVEGPLLDDADTITYTYDETTGDLLSVNSPAVGTTYYSEYDGAGNKGGITDPNGNSIAFTYDGRGRVSTVTDLTDNSVTAYTYNTAGDLLTVTGPNGVTSDFEYEATYGRMVTVSDPLGNTIHYAYDLQGNRIEKSLLDSTSEQVFFQRFDYQHPDYPGKLYRETNPDGTYTEYEYDAMGNIRSVTDSKGNTTTYTYNPKNLLTQIEQPGDTDTFYGYDSLDNLISVTDAEDRTTLYEYDDAGRMLSTDSPDTGITTYAYDSAGNLIAKTDANGNTVTYAYDAANRLTAIRFPDPGQNIDYTYDQGPNGAGRLTGMSDPTGVYAYTYDSKGNLTREEKTLESVTYTTAYTYDAAGVLTGITYPNGRTVTYSLDAAGRVDQITTQKDGIPQTVAQGIRYLPYGPLAELTYGNGTVLTQSFDLLFRPSAISAADLVDYAYETDPAGNITAIADTLDPARSRSFAYDDLNRLTGASGIFGAVGYTYDKVGNRLTQTENGQQDSYTYPAGSHRLSSISGPNAQSFSYDANGNTTAMDETTLAYNQNDRLIRVARNGTTAGEYTYNANGQRVKKTADGKTTLFHYDRFGNLIGESDTNGNFTREYICLNTLRLAAFAEEIAQNLTVDVVTDKGRILSGIRVYAFTESGAYTGKYAVTDESGIAEFGLGDFADNSYKFRADYLGDQFWSDVIAIPGAYATQVQIREEPATLTVTRSGTPVEGVKVYLFNEDGAYLGLYEITDADGEVGFDLPVGESFTFRADLLGHQYFIEDLTITDQEPNTFTLATGGGLLDITVQKEIDDPISGIKVYLFNDKGSYLGVGEKTDGQGLVSFKVSSGAYKVRADYLGYQFWIDSFDVVDDMDLVLSIPHTDVNVTVEGDNDGDIEPRENLKVYLFTPVGAYLGQYLTTNGNGEATFSLPDNKAYKVRADYLSQQFWSTEFTGTDKTVTIEEGIASVSVTGAGMALDGIKVYLFNSAGAYLGWYAVSDAQGMVYFRLPQGNYDFRADTMGNQYWSGLSTIIKDQGNPVSISTGGGAFVATIRKGENDPLTGAKCYLFNDTGAYLGKSGITNDSGQVSFDLTGGDYEIRIDHLGYQFWTRTFTVPTDLSLEHTIDHQDVTVTVDRDFAGDVVPGANLKVYLFTPTGAYLGRYQVSNENGQATFNLPQTGYKVRADYLMQQFWSEPFTWTDETITIHEGEAEVIVKQGTAPLENVTVYVFTALKAYLGLSGKTDTEGKINFRLPAGNYQFRADYQGSQHWIAESILADQVNSVDLNTGGGQFQLTVQKAPEHPMTGIKVYVFSSAGSYLGMYSQTDDNGQVFFTLSEGAYMFRADYLGYKFWTQVYSIPGSSAEVLAIEHQDVTVTVNSLYNYQTDPIENIKVYLFRADGGYMGRYAKTGADGQVVFSLPKQDYEVRADYLGSQYWSEVIYWQDRDIDIDHGKITLHVTNLGGKVAGAKVYLFTESGSYLGRYETTNETGTASFTLPVSAYKFRVDHAGSQYWSNPVTPIANDDLTLDTQLDLLAGQLTNDPNPTRFDGTPPEPEKLMLASLGTITGLISQTVVAQTPQKKIYYYLNDHLGTPIKVIDENNTVVWAADYKPFGEADILVDTFDNNFRFPGQYYDTESDIIYNYHRYYQPEIGRYLRTDPLGLSILILAKNNVKNAFIADFLFQLEISYPQLMNLYGYAVNDPVGEIDPDGRFYQYLPYLPVLFDFMQGFVVPGPPPPTPGGYAGYATREILEKAWEKLTEPPKPEIKHFPVPPEPLVKHFPMPQDPELPVPVPEDPC